MARPPKKKPAAKAKAKKPARKRKPADDGVIYRKRTAVLYSPDRTSVAVLLVIDGTQVDCEMSVAQARDLYFRLERALTEVEN